MGERKHEMLILNLIILNVINVLCNWYQQFMQNPCRIFLQLLASVDKRELTGGERKSSHVLLMTSFFKNSWTALYTRGAFTNPFIAASITASSTFEICNFNAVAISRSLVQSFEVSERQHKLDNLLRRTHSSHLVAYSTLFWILASNVASFYERDWRENWLCTHILSKDVLALLWKISSYQTKLCCCVNNKGEKKNAKNSLHLGVVFLSRWKNQFLSKGDFDVWGIVELILEFWPAC